MEPSTKTITITHKSTQKSWPIDSNSLFKVSSIIESFFTHESAEKKSNTLIIDDEDISSNAIEQFINLAQYPSTPMGSYNSFLSLSSILDVPLVAPIVERYQTQSLIRLMKDLLEFSCNSLDGTDEDAKTQMLENIIALDTMIDADWSVTVINLLTEEGFPPSASSKRNTYSSPQRSTPSPLPRNRFSPSTSRLGITQSTSNSNTTGAATARRKIEVGLVQSSLRQKLSHSTLAKCCNIYFGTPEVRPNSVYITPSTTTDNAASDGANTSSRIRRAMRDRDDADITTHLRPTNLFPYLNNTVGGGGGTRPWADYRSNDYGGGGGGEGVGMFS